MIIKSFVPILPTSHGNFALFSLNSWFAIHFSGSFTILLPIFIQYCFQTFSQDSLVGNTRWTIYFYKMLSFNWHCNLMFKEILNQSTILRKKFTISSGNIYLILVKVLFWEIVFYHFWNTFYYTFFKYFPNTTLLKI